MVVEHYEPDWVFWIGAEDMAKARGLMFMYKRGDGESVGARVDRAIGNMGPEGVLDGGDSSAVSGVPGV